MAEADGRRDARRAGAQVSFVKRYEPLGWIIGTGRYVDDIETAIAEKTADAEEQVGALVRRIMLASLVVVALAVGGVSFLAATLTNRSRSWSASPATSPRTRSTCRAASACARRTRSGSSPPSSITWRSASRRASATYASSARLLQSVLSNVPHSDLLEGPALRLPECNDRFAQRIRDVDGGHRREDRRAARLGDEQRERLAARDRTVMDEGAPLLDQRESLRDASGRDIDCLASRVPLRDQAGNLIGMLGCSSRSRTLRPSERGGMRSRLDA